MIEVQHLVKSFGSVKAVNQISFDVKAGEIFGILGPNGAGKTTTLECIEGLQKATSGEIRVLGMDVARAQESVKKRIGIQLQSSSYFEYLTLKELLQLFAHFYGKSIDAQELLNKMGLQDKINTTVDKLSGGQKQRFSIAVTLVNNPDVIFLDEPTTGLDPQARRNVWELIQSINANGITIVLTTHYMEEAQYLCHRVAIMDYGEIVAMDTPNRLIAALPTPYIIEIHPGAKAIETDLKRLDSVIYVHSTSDEGFQLGSRDASSTIYSLAEWARDNHTTLGQLEVIPADLENVFLALTGHTLRD